MWPAIVLLGLVTLQRMAEMVIAQINARRLRHLGGYEVASSHYPLIVVLHAAWLAALWWLAPARPIQLPFLALFGLLELGRVWVLWALGQRWTTRIMVVPGETLIARGPYRYVDHPNYWVVTCEVAVLPLVFGLWQVALVFSLLNAAVLTIRIRAENGALRR